MSHDRGATGRVFAVDHSGCILAVGSPLNMGNRTTILDLKVLPLGKADLIIISCRVPMEVDPLHWHPTHCYCYHCFVGTLQLAD